MKLTAKDLLQNHVIDRMFTEPEEGLENNLEFTTTQMKAALEETVPQLLDTPTDILLQKRYERFRQYGEYTE